ncbi:MAG: PIN domain-containing protein [Bacteroidota bacterium]|jgi:predicted nucleic acid-binding protein|nr:PIN domain-containing protein [Bacteroidota bacterium]
MTVYVDTNVLVDLVDEERPLFKEASVLFNAAAQNKLRIVLSSQSVADCAYVIRKAPREQFKRKMKELLHYIVILPITDMEILRALKSDCPDFEDALQIACAESNTVNILVTNNKKDFKRFTDLPVYTSKEFVMRITR